jgi:hypothetical protein
MTELKDSLAQLTLTLQPVGAGQLPSLPTIHMIRMNEDELTLDITLGKNVHSLTLEAGQVKMLQAYLDTLL